MNNIQDIKTGSNQNQILVPTRNITPSSRNVKKTLLTKLKAYKIIRFDVLNSTLSGVYREIFNAWNPTESKVFTSLNKVFNPLNNKPSPLRLQLIPIDPKQTNVFVEFRNTESHGD